MTREQTELLAVIVLEMAKKLEADPAVRISYADEIDALDELLSDWKPEHSSEAEVERSLYLLRRQRELLAEVERLREALTTCKELAESTSNGHHRVALASVHRVTEKALEPTPLRCEEDYRPFSNQGGNHGPRVANEYKERPEGNCQAPEGSRGER